ncbi:hypothetical protein RND81_03G077300 [Saponaria officinalis]|uniref:FBD domain-containing protein n=1 Tax=Saponaria officinalis TaxID=3572 RepID=A0AAW1LYZ9_SAPOF
MSFERFVYGVLAIHRISPIHKFKLILETTLQYDCSHLVVWITAAILKGVQHLDLRIGNHPKALPSSILDCQTLTVLKIYTFGYDLSVPGIVCLPNLRTLKLHCIRFLDGDSVKRFFGGCSQLKELALFFCRFTTDHVRVSGTELRKLSITSCRGHVVIDAPNLASLTYVCSPSSTDMGVKNLRSLLSIELWPILMSKPPQVLSDIIKGANNARELILLHSAAKGLIEKNDMEHELHSDVAFPLFSSNVKTVEVRQFRGHKLELLLLKYLLENARVLQKLILIKDGTTEMKRELQVSEELLLLPKASTYCTIELKEP